MKTTKAAALRPLIADVQSELNLRLAELECGGLSAAESTGEFEKLGDSLTMAANAAKTAAALRRRMHELVIMENLEKRHHKEPRVVRDAPIAEAKHEAR